MLVDRTTAEEKSLEYEDFEDKCLDKIIEGEVIKGHKIILVEFGVGTGRYVRHFFRKDSPFAKDILLFVGLDFSLEMIGKSFNMLSEVSMKDEIGRKIFLVRWRAEDFSLCFNRHEELKKATPIVFCMFNTLGNIGLRNRRIKVVANMKKIMGPNGIGIISIFNREEFVPLAFRYYGTKQMSPIMPEKKKKITFDINKGDIITGDPARPDFYSHWFSEKELDNVLKQVKGLKKIPGLTTIGNQRDIVREDPRGERGIIYTFTWE
jgi:SAM-dependent methyltransferase